MSHAPDTVPRAVTLAEFLVHALVIELEAVQSYQDLTKQMIQCNNFEVAELFAKLAEIEAQHAEAIRAKAGDIELPDLAPWEFRWDGMEPPENIDLAGVHYLMTPHQALTLALENEISAMKFFQAIADDSTDERVRALALEFADDERQHAAWVEEWLARYDEPDADWHYDPDAPVAID